MWRNDALKKRNVYRKRRGRKERGKLAMA